MRLDLVQIPDVLNIMQQWIVSKGYGNYIVIANANDMVMGKKNYFIRKTINESSLSVPDGISLVMLSRIYGYPLKKRVYGPDLMLKFLKVAEDKGYSIFFYGSTQQTLGLLTKNLKFRFPHLQIAGIYSAPFRDLTEDEDRKITEKINQASPDVLWIGLGCPKQQLWMYEHKNKLKVPVMVGVGAAFDFLAGTKSQSPRWIRDNGFEWLFRLITEPKRLWRRYLINGSLFIYYLGKELILRVLKINRETSLE